MAKNPETVKSFLTDLTEKLKKLWAAEKEAMLKLKEGEAEQLGFDFDGKINKEDFWLVLQTIRQYKYDKLNVRGITGT